MTFFTGEELVGEFLEHYADPNYDPAKAHEYYLMTRELQGRKPRGPAAPKVPKGPKGPSAQTLANRAAALVKQHQREALRNSKQQLSVAKQTDLKNSAHDQAARLAQVKANADATKARIQDALNAKLAEIAAKANLKFEPTKLIDIPADATPKVREYLTKQNERRLQVANRQQQTALAAANRDKSAATQQAQKAAMAEMHKVGTDLRDTVAQARIDYTNAKAQLVERYKQAGVAAQQNITQNVR